jgi:hypothetical protein
MLLKADLMHSKPNSLFQRLQKGQDGVEGGGLPQAAAVAGHRAGEEEHDVLHESGGFSREYHFDFFAIIANMANRSLTII